jgi:hypothetical protein
MAEEKVEVRDINFRQVLPWTELFRGFQVAFDLKKLVLATAGILLMAFGWWLWAVIFFSQSKPKWEQPKYAEIAKRYAPKSEEDAKAIEERQQKEAWDTFKDDRDKWNILLGAAGTKESYKDKQGNQKEAPYYRDAGDIATSVTEYDAIKKPIDDAIDEMRARNELQRTVTVGGVDYPIYARPYGNLRTWPWFQDRGPNPYLMVTGQAGRPWEASSFGHWLIFDESQVLLEPLFKFLYPVTYLLYPKTGALNRLYFLLVTLTTLAVWALFGGAMTRIASVQLARNDKIGMTEALRFVAARYLSFLSAPIFPLLFLAFMVVLLVIYGAFFAIPVFGDVVMALLWPLVIMAGVAMAVVLVGLVGWPLMYATISAEGSDSFDAISRSYSYVYQNPWHYAWYSVVALAYGAVLVFFVGFMGSMIVYLGKWGVSQTPWIESADLTKDRDPTFLFVWAPESFGWRTLLLQGKTINGDPLVVNGQVREDLLATYINSFSWYNKFGAFLVTVWLYAFFLVVLGFGYSYFWSASTIIYLLMRRKVDDTDLDEVYLEEDEAEESYSSSTTMPAPAPAPAGPSLQMVDAPTLRSTTPSTSITPAESVTPAGESKTPPGDGAKS